MRHYLISLLLALQGSRLFGDRARIAFLRLIGMKVHQSARLSWGIHFGSRRNVTIGRGVYINKGAFFDGYSHIVIGDHVSFGPNVSLITRSHNISPGVIRNTFRDNIEEPIVIERGCWLGLNVGVLPGVTIREGCVVGAGALVTRDTEPHGLYLGSPARRVRDLPLDAGQA